jgi:hypothetical protein
MQYIVERHGKSLLPQYLGNDLIYYLSFIFICTNRNVVKCRDVSGNS